MKCIAVPLGLPGGHASSASSAATRAYASSTPGRTLVAGKITGTRPLIEGSGHMGDALRAMRIGRLPRRLFTKRGGLSASEISSMTLSPCSERNRFIGLLRLADEVVARFEARDEAHLFVE